MTKFITTIIALIISISIFAQSESTITTSSKGKRSNFILKGQQGAFGESLFMADLVDEAPNATVGTELVKGFKRTAKPLETNFTGITVQVLATDRLLNANHPVFSQFGNIKVKEMLSPKYCYFVGEFASQKGAKQYCEQIVKSRYSDAKVVSFKEGRVQIMTKHKRKKKGHK